MSNPEDRFEAGDVSFFNLPRRRLVFGGISDRYCLVHYEYGGIAHGYLTALFELSGNNPNLCGLMQAAGTPASTSLPKKPTG